VATHSAKGLAAAHVTGDTTDDEVKVRVRRREFQLVYMTPELTGKTVHKYGLNGNTVRVQRTEDRRSQTDADLHGIRLRSP